MSDKTPFERSIQQSLEGYQAPYDPSAWDGIEAGLDRMEQGPKKGNGKAKKTGKWTAIAIGGAAVIAGTALFMDSSSEEGKNEGDSSAQQEERIVRNEEGGMDPGTKASGSEERSSGEGSKNAPGTEQGSKEEKSSPKKESSDKEVAETWTEGKDQEKPEKKEEPASEESEEDPSITEPDKEQENEFGQPEESSPFPEELTLRANRKEGCPPLEVSFGLEEELENVDHFWKFGDGTYSNKAAPTHRYTEAGEHDVTLTLTDRSSGKTRKVAEEDLISVNRPPKGRIEKVPTDRHMRKPRPITVFELQGSRGVDDIVWQLGDGTRIEGKRKVEHRYPAKGIYRVRVYLKGHDGCKDTLRYRCKKDKSYDLLAPNSFQPNGNGRNDRFIPEALKVLDVPFTMTIHDRSGRVVYKTKDASDPWNGRVQNSGEKVKDGNVYLWVVVLENENGEEETYKGQVTVVR